MGFLAFVTGFLIAYPANSQSASADNGDRDALSSPPKWGASIDVEGKLGTKRNLGEADALVPFWQDDRSLVFGNARFRLDDDNSQEGNLGLGLRHMLDGEWNLGTYGYFDRRRTENDHMFNQLTFGAEALGRDWDMRANSYWPIGETVKFVDALNTAELSGTSILFRGGEEHAMRGFDAEIGWRVPVFEFESPYDFRVFGGGFRFDSVDGNDVPDVTGPRLRAEFTAYELPYLGQGTRLTLGAEWQHDDVRDGQAFASARLRIPLQSEAQRNRVLTAQERRMTAPIVRDIDIVAQAGAFSAPETATQTASGQAITVLSSASTTGANLGTAVAAAGANSTVLLSGSFATTTNVVTLQSGQMLMGAGNLVVRSPSGRTATLHTGSSGTIAGTVTAGNAATLEMATNSTLTGLTVTNTRAANTVVAVHVGAVSGATISNNTLTATRTAAGANPVVAINLPAVSSNTTISGNTLTATASGGGGSETQGIRALGASTNVTVSGNSFNSSGSLLATNDITIKADAGAVSFVTAASSGNVVINGDHNCPAATGAVSFTDGTTCP